MEAASSNSSDYSEIKFLDINQYIGAALIIMLYVFLQFCFFLNLLILGIFVKPLISGEWLTLNETLLVISIISLGALKLLLKKPRPLIKKTLILLTLIPANIAIIILRGLELHAGKMPLKFLLIPIIIFFTYLIFSIYGLYLAVKEKKGTSLAIGTVASVFVFGPLLFFYFFIIMMAQSTTPPRGGCDQSSIYKEMCEAKTSERLCIIADLDADGVGDCVWDSKTKECNLDPNKTPAPCYWR